MLLDFIIRTSPNAGQTGLDRPFNLDAPPGMLDRASPSHRELSTMRCALLALVAIFTPGDDFPTPRDSEREPVKTMPAAESAATFRVPEGFKVEVFAAEPDVRNPIAMTWDARGRLWIAENYTYAEPSVKFDLTLRDRVLIFDDADGDGKPEKRTVFTDDVQRLTSVEIGRGGVWLMAPPQLLFVPDRDGDDKPDGPTEVVLDGFDLPTENYHNFANGLKWGPDGWLYGRCGASSPGNVGAPGTKKEDRIPLGGGIWRYHPERKTFEVICHGTTNPWGHDWNAVGDGFFINTVNGHLWHMIPGMHYVRPHTIDPNPRVYELVDQHADHWHWDHSKDWTDSRKNTPEHDRAGGGHAHIGAMIYQGGQWPESMRGRLFTINMHGRRLNQERLEREGSGYVARHEPDPIFAADPYFRGIDLSEGPDGSVYVIDWNDTGECHDNTGVLRSSGRIYRIVYEPNARPRPSIDQAKWNSASLATTTVGTDEWHSRQARQVLADRATRGEDMRKARNFFLGVLADDNSTVLRLRALWGLDAMQTGLDEMFVPLLQDRDEEIRVWAVRLLTDGLPMDTAIGKRPPGPDIGLNPAGLDGLASLASSKSESPAVRLALASALQRLPVEQRALVARGLAKHAEDADDHNLPLLVWYGLIPVADSDPMGLAKLGAECALPTTRRLIARRLAESLSEDPAPLGVMIAKAKDAPDAYRADLLNGITEGLRGWRKATPPSEWTSVAATFESSANKEVRDRARELSVLFGDGRALDEVKALALDDKADLESRRAALRTLIDARPDDLRATCEALLKVRFLNTTAVRGLSLFDDPKIGESLAAYYRSFHPSERPAVIDTLAARRAFALPMLDAVANGKIPKSDVTAFHARQLRSIGDDAITKRLAEVWGELRDSPADKAATIAALKTKLTPEVLAKAAKSSGRAQFQKLCASCHTLYGQGGQIGPDLTGAGRDNLDYVLENVIDPSAAVTADYRMVVVATDDGRVLNGIIKAQTDKTLTLQTQAEALTLAKTEIEAIKPSPQSLMPEGQLDPLSEAEVRDLVAYLMSRSQVPLP